MVKSKMSLFTAWKHTGGLVVQPHSQNVGDWIHTPATLSLGRSPCTHWTGGSVGSFGEAKLLQWSAKITGLNPAWNAITGRSHFIPELCSRKSCANRKHANQTQNPHLKSTVYTEYKYTHFSIQYIYIFPMQ